VLYEKDSVSILGRYYQPGTIPVNLLDTLATSTAELMKHVKLVYNPNRKTYSLPIGFWRRSATISTYTAETKKYWDFIIRWADINQALFQVCKILISIK
jgi:hypothetical protein